jgi:hypothetical protein
MKYKVYFYSIENYGNFHSEEYPVILSHAAVPSNASLQYPPRRGIWGKGFA